MKTCPNEPKRGCGHQRKNGNDEECLCEGGGREGGREGGRVGRREGGREGEKEKGKIKSFSMDIHVPLSGTTKISDCSHVRIIHLYLAKKIHTCTCIYMHYM